MKKVLLILTVLLTLTLFIIPASASELDGTGATQYILVQEVQGLYAVRDTENNHISFVITDEFLDFLAEEYILFKDREYKSYNFSMWLIDKGYNFPYNDSVNRYVQAYESSQLTSTVDAAFNEYKGKNSDNVTLEGFEEYLYNYDENLYYSYTSSTLQMLNQSMYSAGASYSGSSGNTTPDETGDSYGKSHTNTNHSVGDSDCCYDPGYTDGLDDGGDVYKNSEEYQTTINEEKTNAVNSFLQSEEYLQSIENIKTESSESAIKEYLTGEEYQGAMDSAYAIGSENAYNQAYQDAASEVFELGKAAGYDAYKGSQDFINAIDSSYENGWRNGESYANENAINPGGVIILLVLVIAGISILLILTKVKKKGRK